jgi:hypothetical protein
VPGRVALKLGAPLLSASVDHDTLNHWSVREGWLLS